MLAALAADRCFLPRQNTIPEEGWPSFWEPASKGALEYKKDFSLSGKRVEVRCAKCGGHLGHVFDDGPTKTGKRYCINSVCLDLEEK